MISPHAHDGPQAPLNGAAFIALLNSIEAQIDPARCAVAGLNVWPILRFEINYNRKMGQVRSEIAFEEPGLFKRLKLRVKRRQSSVLERARTAELPSDIQALDQAEVLFVNRRTQYVHTRSGQTHQPFTDGISHLVEPHGGRHLTLVNEDPRQEGETYLVDAQTVALKSAKPIFRLLSPETFAELEAQRSILAHVRAVNGMLADLAPDLVMDEGRILRNVDMALRKIRHFDQVLEQVRPKAVFLSSYTGGYHICAACRRHGIPVVDVQHGGMHAHHPLAAHWSHVPKGGYEFLPDVFWCWSERTADMIAESLAPHHRTIVGGNPKAALEAALMASSQQASPLPERPQILVALQYGAEELVSPHLRDAFAATRDHVDWHFRLHPMGWDRKDEAVQVLGLDEAALMASSRMPLQPQLAQMDLLLTNMSTIVHDARELDVQAAVCTGQGAAFFDDLIRAGEVAFLENLEAVLACINDLDLSAERRAQRHTLAAELGRAAIAQIQAGYDEVLRLT